MKWVARRTFLICRLAKLPGRTAGAAAHSRRRSSGQTTLLRGEHNDEGDIIKQRASAHPSREGINPRRGKQTTTFESALFLALQVQVQVQGQVQGQVQVQVYLHVRPRRIGEEDVLEPDSSSSGSRLCSLLRKRVDGQRVVWFVLSVLRGNRIPTKEGRSSSTSSQRFCLERWGTSQSAYGGVNGLVGAAGCVGLDENDVKDVRPT